MRILHLVHQYLPDNVGGTELYTYWVSQALARRGHEVAVFYRRSAVGKGLEARRDAAGVQIWAAWHGLADPTRRFLAAFGDRVIEAAFERVLDEVHPDLVHVEHLMGLPIALVNALHRRKMPFVVTFWDFWWVCANAQLLTNYSQQICDGPHAYLNCARCAAARAGQAHLWPAWLPLAGLLAWRNHLLRRVMAAAHRLIAPTEFVRCWYRQHGVDADKLIVLPPGLEERPAMPAITASDRPLRIAYIGGLAWQKGVHVLVEAFGGLVGRAELWIAGDENADPAYVGRLRAAAGPGVRFLGRLDRDQVWATLAQVDVVAVPTLWYETFSFIVSEAFTAGVPVIASRLGPLADRVHHGEDGLLLPPGDAHAWRSALQQLVDDPIYLERLRNGVRPPLRLAHHVEHLSAIYQEAISHGRRDRQRDPSSRRPV